MAPLAERERRQAVRAFAAGLSSATSLNRPKDWQAFERLTRDLFARITGDVHMDLHGRNGQPQSGVDVSGIDQRTRVQVGIQCRGRGDGSAWTNSRLTQKELREEVAKARSFYPSLDVFVVLTTGPNDVLLKKAAAEISERHARDGSFEIQVHGWDWLEGRLSEHADLAIRYGLIAVASPVFHDSTTASAIAKQIGARLATAVELMNDRRSVNERFTLQSISKHLGFPDWRKLEDITEGRSDVIASELVNLARALGINEQWLLEGKQTPFRVDPEDYRGAEEQFDSIQRLNPRRIVFVRQSEDDFESIVAAEIDDFRWVTFHWDHPTSSHVGGTGKYQLLEYCCLIRRLFGLLTIRGRALFTESISKRLTSCASGRGMFIQERSFIGGTTISGGSILQNWRKRGWRVHPNLRENCAKPSVSHAWCLQIIKGLLNVTAGCAPSSLMQVYPSTSGNLLRAILSTSASRAIESR